MNHSRLLSNSKQVLYRNMKKHQFIDRYLASLVGCKNRYHEPVSELCELNIIRAVRREAWKPAFNIWIFGNILPDMAKEAKRDDTDPGNGLFATKKGIAKLCHTTHVVQGHPTIQR